MSYQLPAMPDTFQSLLDAEFRWPRKGDRPFQASPDWWKNASTEENAFSRLVLMIVGYKIGADLMVERARSSDHDRDCLVYSIIFNYRHFIELSLKHLIAWYGPMVGVEADWKSHNLATLWKKFREVLKGYGIPDSDESSSSVARTAAEFAKIDPESYSHRYPVDRDGKPLPVTRQELDLDQLKDVMDGVKGFFDGCDGYLDDLKSAAPRYEKT